MNNATPTEPGSNASVVLYPAIAAAMEELEKLPTTFNFTVNRAFNILHEAYWSECPAPASASPLRPVDPPSDAPLTRREPVGTGETCESCQ